MYQTIQKLLEEDLRHTAASTDVANRSSVVDKGLNSSGGGGLPGAQGSIAGSMARQSNDSTAATSAQRQQSESYTGHYIGMTLWLHKEHLLLTRDCKHFFANTWDDYGDDNLAAILKDFQSTFGTTFYREVDVGVSRHTLAASRQDDATRSREEHNSRTLSADVRGEGPNANLGVGGHHKTDGGYSASGTTTSGNRGGSHYSHGGAANLAHTDDQTWRQSLKDPASWVIIADRRRDAISTLHLIRDVAKIVETKNDQEAAIVVQRSSDLLQHIRRLKQPEQRLKAIEVRRACSQDIVITTGVRNKTLRVTACASEGLQALRVRPGPLTDALTDHSLTKGKPVEIVPYHVDDLLLCSGELTIRKYPCTITILCDTAIGWSAKSVEDQCLETLSNRLEDHIIFPCETSLFSSNLIYDSSLCEIQLRIVSNKASTRCTIPLHNADRYQRLMAEHGLDTPAMDPPAKVLLPADARLPAVTQP